MAAERAWRNGSGCAPWKVFRADICERRKQALRHHTRSDESVIRGAGSSSEFRTVWHSAQRCSPPCPQPTIHRHGARPTDCYGEGNRNCQQVILEALPCLPACPVHEESVRQVNG